MTLGETAVIPAGTLFTKLKGTQFKHNKLQISCKKRSFLALSVCLVESVSESFSCPTTNVFFYSLFKLSFRCDKYVNMFYYQHFIMLICTIIFTALHPMYHKATQSKCSMKFVIHNFAFQIIVSS